MGNSAINRTSGFGNYRPTIKPKDKEEGNGYNAPWNQEGMQVTGGENFFKTGAVGGVNGVGGAPYVSNGGASLEQRMASYDVKGPTYAQTDTTYTTGDDRLAHDEHNWMVFA